MAANGGNNVANAVGTALQFMPQPDSLGVENLKGIQGVQGRVATGDIGNKSYAAGVENLINAYGGFVEAREKNFQKEMADGAAKMLSRTTEEDIQKLQSVEIAQKYGYATLVDNPYFHAYTDNLIGQHNTMLAYDKYQTMYADKPARTPEEEQQRWDAFVSNEAATYLEGKPDTNQVAYMEGFTTKKHELLQNMMDARMKQDVANKVAQAQATISAQVQDIVYNATGKPWADVTTELQRVFDESNLISMSPEYKYNMLEKIPLDLAQHGRQSTEDIMNILKNLKVDVNLAGEEVTADNFVSPLAFSGAAVKWQQAHHTQLYNNIFEKYSKEPDISKMRMDIQAKYQSTNPADWNTAEIMESVMPAVEQEINNRKAQAKSRHAGLKSSLKAAAKRSEKKAQGQTDNVLANANIDSYIEHGGNMVDRFGNTIGNVRRADGQNVPEAVLQQAWLQRFATNLLDTSKAYDERLDKATNLMKYPGAQKFVKVYQGQVRDLFRNLPEDQLQKGLIEGDATNLYNMYLNNPEKFQEALGTENSVMMNTIKVLSSMSGYKEMDGGLAKGILGWHNVANLSTDELNKKTSAWNSYLDYVIQKTGSAPDINGVFQLEFGTHDTITFADIQGNNTLSEMATTLVAAGLPMDKVTQEIGNTIRDHYMYYKGALLPDNLFDSIFPNDNPNKWTPPALGRYAIETMCLAWLKQNGQEANMNMISSIKWNDTSGILYVTGVDGSHFQVTRGQLANEMKYVAASNILPEVTTVGEPDSVAKLDNNEEGLGDNPFSIFG